MKAKFTAYNDPSHGWLKVPIELLERVNIAKEISAYSYVRNNNAYLEEDCDAPRFLEAFTRHTGKVAIITDRYSNKTSRIRGYEGFRQRFPIQKSN